VESTSGVTRKSGEKSSRPNLSGDVWLRKGWIWYRARRKMDSTRASAMRLLTSRRSIIPQKTGQTAETAPTWCELNSIIHGAPPRRTITAVRAAGRGGAQTPAGRDAPIDQGGLPMLTRRQMLATTSTFAGYAIAVDKVLAQAIKTDTDGIIAGDQIVKI